MARVLLLSGGNTGDIKRTLQAAQQLLNERVGAVLRCSHRYESAPWGFEGAERFSNQALALSTALEARATPRGRSTSTSSSTTTR